MCKMVKKLLLFVLINLFVTINALCDEIPNIVVSVHAYKGNNLQLEFPGIYILDNNAQIILGHTGPGWKKKLEAFFSDPVSTMRSESFTESQEKYLASYLSEKQLSSEPGGFAYLVLDAAPDVLNGPPEWQGSCIPIRKRKNTRDGI